MKVVIATGIYPPDLGGPAFYAEKLANYLMANGHEVKVITYGATDSGSKSAFPIVISRSRSSFGRKIRYYRALKNYARDADCLVAFDDFSSALPAALAARALNKKLYIRLGGDFLWERAAEKSRTILPFANFYDHPTPLLLRFVRWLSDFSIKSATKLIFSTDFQRSIYLRHRDLQPDRTVTLGNPLPEFFRPASSPDGGPIIFAGRLIRLKNIDGLFQAFRLLRERFPKAELLIVGDGPEAARLRRAASDPIFQGKINFIDKSSRAETLALIARARFLVLPSFSDISPNVIFDCLAAGAPFILTEETGLRPILGEAVIYANPRDPADLAEKMSQLMADDQLASYRADLRKIEYRLNWEDWLLAFSKIIGASPK